MKIFKVLLSIMVLFAVNSKSLISDDAKLLFEKTLQTESGKMLVTSLIAGSIKVSSWSNNEVNVKVYGNDEAEEKIVFFAENTESGVKIEGKQKESKNFNNLTIRVEIIVPQNYDIQLHSAGGSFKISNVIGKIEANSSGGSITVENTVGDLKTYTAGGNILIESSSGNIEASTSGGKIAINGFIGNVDVSTAGGDINLVGQNGKVEASTAGGNIRLDYSGSNMGMDMSTLGGNITASLPQDFNADADIGTLVGRITCDFANVEGKNKISSYVRAKFNNGGEVFRCTTSAGNIVVNKK